jgi:hypothetical protein
MAKFQLKFLDFYDENEIEVFKQENTINIFITEKFDGTNTESISICLDKSTAIKFAKTLRTEINKITESEDKNV